MRPLESYVVYLSLYAVWGESVPGARWALWALLIATLAHLLLERPRWQLGLLYAQVAHLLYAAFVSSSSCEAAAAAAEPTSWTFIVLSSLAILATSALACLLPIAKFPALSGRFQSVGVIQRFLPTVDHAHPHAHPELGVTVFYPAGLSAPTRTGARFLPPAVLPALASTLSMPSPIFAHLSLAKIRAVAEMVMSPPSDGPEGIPERFPVLVMSHGLTGTAGMYSMQACELASQGYVVFAPTHNDGSACLAELSRGKTVPYTTGLVYGEPGSIAVRAQQLETRVQEVTLLIDTIVAAETKGSASDGWPVPVPFAGRLDTTRLGLVGHSFGGATAVASAAREAGDQGQGRVRAVVSHDVWMEPIAPEVLAAGLKGTPALHTLSQQWFEWTLPKEQTVAFAKSSIAATAAGAGSAAADEGAKVEVEDGHTTILQFPGTRHSNYSDIPLFSQILSRKMAAIGPRDFRTAMQHINQAQIEFLDKHVKGASNDETAAETKSASSSPTSGSGKRMFDALLKSKVAVTVPIHQE